MRTVFIILGSIGIWGSGVVPGMGQGTVPAQGYTLTVNVSQLHSDAGKLYLSLYNSPTGYPKNASVAYRLAFSEIRNGKATIALDHLPPGDYAIACYHDENNNGKIDTNFFGMPTEGTGASNDARGSFGPPRFSDAKFKLDADTTLGIRIHY
jgi:uncharacterized protein (DUF2141 family)